MNGSSSMSSTGYTNVKKKKVKPYKTVSLENMETLGSESGDAGYSVVQNPPSGAAVKNKPSEAGASDVGYSVIQSPPSEAGASDVGYSVVQSPPSEPGASDVGYSVVQSPTIEASATLSTEGGYLVVPSPNLTTDSLNVSSADHSLRVSTIRCTELSIE